MEQHYILHTACTLKRTFCNFFPQEMWNAVKFLGHNQNFSQDLRIKVIKIIWAHAVQARDEFGFPVGYYCQTVYMTSSLTTP